jgi:hypothetical protein
MRMAESYRGVESYRGHVANAFELLAQGLAPFVDRRMSATMPGQDWILEAATKLGKRRDVLVSLSDPHFQLEVLNRWWGPAFAAVLPPSCRTHVNDLRTARNHWAHPDQDVPIDFEYATRVHHSCEELLRAVGAPESEQMLELTEDLRWESVRRAARVHGVSETDALMGQLADLQKEYDELQAQLAEARTQAQSASGRTRAFARQLAELQAQYAAVSGLREQYQTLQRQLEEERRARSDDEGVHDQLSETELALGHLQHESSRLREELEAARRAMMTLDPSRSPAARRWIWLATALILVLAVMVVVAYSMGQSAAGLSG